MGVEKRLEAIKTKRCRTEEFVLAALRRAINDGLNLEIEAIWAEGKVAWIDSVLEVWLKDEDGKLAVDRLVTLIIH